MSANRELSDIRKDCVICWLQYITPGTDPTNHVPAASCLIGPGESVRPVIPGACPRNPRASYWSDAVPTPSSSSAICGAASRIYVPSKSFCGEMTKCAYSENFLVEIADPLISRRSPTDVVLPQLTSAAEPALLLLDVR
ncbi:hypothetical protein J6590_003144 [Homalodisca vitripennis]|nr:hypothetical protein J6590_003144 [Homalodisca vitripennis]